MLVKKYGNRRLYDTDRSRYITLDQLAEIIRRGEADEVQVVDAKSGEDLTTATLAQIIVESRGAARLLPAPILVQLIRLGDGALAEFFGTYVTWALDAYLQAKRGVQAMVPVNPFLAPGGAFSRLFGVVPAGAAAPAPPAEERPRDEVAALRRELDELKRSLKRRRR